MNRICIKAIAVPLSPRSLPSYRCCLCVRLRRPPWLAARRWRRHFRGGRLASLCVPMFLLSMIVSSLLARYARSLALGVGCRSPRARRRHFRAESVTLCFRPLFGANCRSPEHRVTVSPLRPRIFGGTRFGYRVIKFPSSTKAWQSRTNNNRRKT